MTAELEVVARFWFPHEAHNARASLEAAGIQVFLPDEHTIAMDWMYGNALGGVRVLVAREDAERARELLDTDHSLDVETEQGLDAATCPRCGGERVRADTVPRRFRFLTMLFFPLLILLVACPRWLRARRYECEDCGTHWNP